MAHMIQNGNCAITGIRAVSTTQLAKMYVDTSLPPYFSHRMPVGIEVSA